MSSAAPSPARVLETVDSLGPPGTPLTTPEVAAEFDCTNRTVYNKLELLVDDGVLETKKVGANSRVWWRPPQNTSESVEGTDASRDDAERKPTEEAPHQSEETYRTVIESIDEGFCILDVLFDEDDEPVDYRYVDTNPVFEEQLGMENAVGNTVRELAPDVEPFWIDVYGEVARTGEPMRFQEFDESLDRWFDVYAFRIDDSDERRVAVLFDDITERKRVQQHLEDERDMFADGPTVVFRWAPDAEAGWPVEYVSENVEDVFGYAPEELESGDVPYTDLLLDEELDRIVREVRENSDEGRERFSHDPYRVMTKSGDVRWVKDVTKIVYDADGEIENYLGYLVDVTDRKEAETELTRTNEALQRLNEVGRQLMDVETEAITDRIADIAGYVLDVEYAALWRYDERIGELRQHASYVDPDAGPDVVRLPDGFHERAWQTFLGDSIEVDNELDVSGGTSSKSSLRSGVLVPLGRHGVLCAGSTRTGAFRGRTIDLVETVAATIETALNRAEDERQLAERKAELERLDRLNTLIRSIDQALVDADGRESIERAVCERLADSDLYEFAWIGSRDPISETITPREWAGVDAGYLDTFRTPVDDSRIDEDPITAAMRTDELQVVGDVAIDPRTVPWREATLDRGARSCVFIPLRYNESRYGVLTVYAAHPQPDERDHAVLAELGETIAHAIDAVETKRTLLTDSVTELTLDVRAADGVLATLAREADCEIEFDGYVPQRDGTAHLFFTTRCCTAADVRSAATRLPGIDEIVRIGEDEAECGFEATVTESTVASHVVDNGGVVRSLTVREATTTVVVDLPADATVREFVDAVEATYPYTELVARHTRDRGIKTRQDLRDALSERFTDRQREILEIAYRSGFFESPRVRTGQELSDALDVTQSTFSHHLREAERCLCELVFENV